MKAHRSTPKRRPWSQHQDEGTKYFYRFVVSCFTGGFAVVAAAVIAGVMGNFPQRNEAFLQAGPWLVVFAAFIAGFVVGWKHAARFAWLGLGIAVLVSVWTLGKWIFF